MGDPLSSPNVSRVWHIVMPKIQTRSKHARKMHTKSSTLSFIWKMQTNPSVDSCSLVHTASVQFLHWQQHQITWGAFTSISCKQNVNTQSSIEAKVALADEAVGSVSCTQRFLQHQNHCTNQNNLCQDNKSAMSLEKNSSKIPFVFHSQ